MHRDFGALAAREFDLLVIGGGINGAGVAREAARRGLSVALVEKVDFGYGTTGRSTRLVHGGLRYLEHYEFALVRQSLRERELLLRNAPHLVRPLRFLYPVYAKRATRWKLRLGMRLYDLLSFDRSMPRSRWLTRAATLAEEPALNPDGLAGAFAFYDAQVPAVERLVLENVEDAVRHGAIVANHAEAVELRLHAGRVTGALVRDALTGATTEVRAKTTLNMTGPWLAHFDVARDRKRLRMTKGIHLVTPRLTSTALVLKAPGDERTFFAVPWYGRSLVGTTDTDFEGNLDDVHADEADIRYMLESARAALPNAPLDAIEFTYAGVRSLLAVEGVAEGVVSRRHELVDHEKTDGIPGLFSLVGGKITPYRGVSQEIVTRVARRAGLTATKGDSESAKLPGAEFVSLDALAAAAVEEGRALGIRQENARHIAELYGSRYRDVFVLVKKDPALAKTLCGHGPTLLAQVAFAAEEESAFTCADVLLRRTIAGFERCEALDEALPATSALLAKSLGWTDAERAASEGEYHAEIAKRHRYAKR